VGEKVQELTAGSGMAGIEDGRCRDGGLTEDQVGAARSKGGIGVPAVGVQEGDGKMAGKLLRVDEVLVVSSVRAKRGRSIGTTVKLSGGGGQDCRRRRSSGVSARGWRRTGQEALVGCSGAGGARDCRHGAVEVADGGE
jgi:hypothetical protein